MLLDGPAAAGAGLVFTALLLVIAHGDLAARRIPNRLVGALAAAGFVASATVLRAHVGWLDALAGALLGFAAWLPLWLLRVVGAGDVKLAAALGAWLGPQGIVQASVLAAMAGGVLAVVVLIHSGAVRRLATDLVCWIGAFRIGGVASGLATRPTPASHGRSVLPYGVALAAGGLLAAWVPRARLEWLTW